MISGYYTALERTLFLNEVDDDSLKAWEANVKVHKRGLELINQVLNVQIFVMS